MSGKNGWELKQNRPTSQRKISGGSKASVLVVMIRHGCAVASDARPEAPKATVQPLLINLTPPITEAFLVGKAAGYVCET